MSEAAQRIEIGRIFSAAMTDIGSDVMRYAGMAGAVGLLGGLVDTYAPRAGNIASNIGIFVISVLAIYQILRTRLSDDDITPRFGAAFGFSFLTGLGIIVGLVLLIVPGLIMFAHWAVGLPALLREKLSVSEAMRRSSQLTKGNRWRILGLALIIWMPFLVVVVVMGGLFGAFAGEESLDLLPFNIAVNMAAGAATILSSICWTHAYLTLSREDERGRSLEQIFA